jgi:phosphodiesterase/alkaline phosphatase D-like protein
MKKLAVVFFIVLITAAAGGLMSSDRLAAGDQAKVGQTASGARITQEPTLESATDTSAIVRWTTNNVEGTSVRYGVVHFGVDPRDLHQVAKSQNRWNRRLPSMTYRVSVDNLEPGLTYYYRVEFTDATGTTEGADGGVHQFTTQRQQ